MEQLLDIHFLNHPPPRNKDNAYHRIFWAGYDGTEVPGLPETGGALLEIWYAGRLRRALDDKTPVRLDLNSPSQRHGYAPVLEK